MQETLEEIRDLLQTAMTTQFNKYYVGKLRFPPKSYLPVLMIYGNETILESDKTTTSRDRYHYKITIEILVNTYAYAATAGTETDEIIDVQKAVVEKMEKRTSGIPNSNTVLGVLRRNIGGNNTNFLFNNDITISYEEENVADTVYFRGIMTLSATTKYAARS